MKPRVGRWRRTVREGERWRRFRAQSVATVVEENGVDGGGGDRHREW
jgi:hypothetical protein